MLGDFYNSFKKGKSNFQLPEAVKEIISKDLPENYGYVYSEQLKRYVVAPIDKNEPQTININFDRSQISDFPNWALENPNATMEYLYRTQKSIKINSALLKDKSGKTYPLSELNKDPFSSNEKIVNEYIIPSPFPEGRLVSFETESGKKRDIVIQRVPCDSREYVKMSNIDFPALSLNLYIPDVGCKGPGKINISATPSKADNVMDAVFSLELLKGYVEGTLKINGKRLGKELPDDPNYNIELMDEKLKYWNLVLSLQEKMGVKFNPQIKMDLNEQRLFEELVLAFVYDQDIEYISPANYFTVNKEAIDDPVFKKTAIMENNGLALSFVNGPEKHKLMGANIKLYTVNLLMGFKIDHMEEVEDNTKIFITSAGDSPWKYYKRYALLKREVISEQKRLKENHLVSK